MEIEFYGANCFKIKTKHSSIVVDDDLDQHGAKNVTKDKDALLVTNQALKCNKAEATARLVLESAGEFEVGDVSVQGIQTRAHLDEAGRETATVFQCSYAGTTVTILGHVHPDISDAVQELAGGTDVLIIPVGGNGFTLDAVGASKVIKAIEPDVVVPSHYESKTLKFEVPAAPLDEFIKTSGLNNEAGTIDLLKVGKATSEIGQTQLVVLDSK